MSIITILSDLQTADIGVCTLKAALIQLPGNNNIIDITHAVGKADIQQAAYLSVSSFVHFPKGTIHLLLVDIFQRNGQKLILARHNDHYFLAPDNGILSLITGDEDVPVYLCREFQGYPALANWIDAIKLTINMLQRGGDPASTFAMYNPERSYKLPQPTIFNSRVDCSILHIDRYGNMILNLNRNQFTEIIGDRKFGIKILGVREEINHISQHYNDVEEGKFLCRFNSSGYLEIAINRSPADSFAPKPLPTRTISYDKISINIHS